MSEKIKKVIINITKKLAKQLIIVSIPVIVLTGLFWATIKKTFDNVSNVFEDVAKNVKILGNNLKFDDEYMEKAKSKLKSMGINTSSLGLTGHEDYLERFLEAEIVTSYPYLGGDGLQGTVYFERAQDDGNVIQLKYMEYNEFYSKKDNDDIFDYFTVDTSDWTVHVKKRDGNIEKIDYKKMVSKYAMPFEFPVALAQVTQNPGFCLAVVKLAKKSRIIITIAESKTITTTKEWQNYDATTTVNYDDGKVEGPSTKSIQTEPTEKTEEFCTTSVYLSRAYTWIANVINDIKYESPETNPDSNPTVSTSEEDLEDTSSTERFEGEDKSKRGTYTIEQKNRKKTTETTTTYYRWKKGSYKVTDQSSNFTRLILRNNTYGNGFVEIAKELHDYLCEYQYYYSSEKNVNAGYYVEDGDAISSKRPIIGQPMSERYLCCTTFSAWVLYTAGYTDIDFRSVGLLAQDCDRRGWEKIYDYSDLEPGDICFWGPSYGDLAHTNVLVELQGNGPHKYYDTGSTDLIRTFEPIEYTPSNDRKFLYAFRPNDEIAQNLNPQTLDKLKSKLEKTISSFDDGKYSVSVENLYDNGHININSERVQSDGLVKLFIMATAYNEVNNGTLKEEDISSLIEGMITGDNNSEANSLIKTIGQGDMAKGIDKINEYLRKNSYASTKITNELKGTGAISSGDDNYTSMSNVSELLTKIDKGSCINKKYSQKMLGILQAAGYDDIIEKVVNEGTVSGTVANKTAEDSDLVSDVAIVSLENSNYVVSISVKGASNRNAAKVNIEMLAKMVNDYFIANGKLKDNDKAKKDKEIETIINGRRVCYKMPDGRYICPLDNLIEGREMLFKLLGSNQKTQMHERLMKYFLYLLTGKDYGVTEFDFNIFLPDDMNSVGGNYNVNTEMEPDLAITDLETLKTALAGAQGAGTDNLVKYAADFLEFQNKYHVNAVFAAAVTITECGAGTNCQIGGNNWWSISNGGAGKWRSYSSPRGSMEDFYKLISSGGFYFDAGKYTVNDIGMVYCENADAPGGWIESVTTYMTNMFNAVGIDISKFGGGDFLAVAEKCHDYVCERNFYYSLKGTYIPITDSEVSIDCSSYVTWVLYEYGYKELAGYQQTTWTLVDRAREYGWTMKPGSEAQPGDILLNPSTHTEIYIGDGKVYNCGSTNSIRSKYTYDDPARYQYAITVTKP